MPHPLPHPFHVCFHLTHPYHTQPHTPLTTPHTLHPTHYTHTHTVHNHTPNTLHPTHYTHTPIPYTTTHPTHYTPHITPHAHTTYHTNPSIPTPCRLTSNESSGKDSAVLAKRVDELKEKLARSEEERLIKSEKYTTVLERNHEVGSSDCLEK